MGKFGLTGTARVMLFTLLALYALFLVAGLCITLLVFSFAHPLAFAFGLTLSSALSAVKVIMLDRTLRKAADMEGENAKNYSALQVILRYFGTILALLPAIFMPNYFNIIGIIIGLLLLQLTAYVSSAIIKKRPDLAELER